MNVSSYDIYKDRQNYLTSRVRLDEEYYIGEYAQESKELLGSGMNVPFDEVGYDDACKQEIKAFLQQIKSDGESHIVTLIGDRENRARLMDMKGNYDAGRQLPYEVFIWDIENLETDCISYRDSMWKYRAMLSMTNCLFFDYDMEKDVICFFRYVAKKSVRLFYGSLEQCEKEMVMYAEQTDKNLLLVKQLAGHLKTGKNSIEVTIQSGFLHMEHKVETLYIRACFDNMYGHRMMYGVVNNLMESEEDLPYYMTTAGLDSATGLLSKRSLIEYTEHILTTPATACRPHYMILMDIDDFKSINDNYGHQAGDQMIQLFASTLSDVVRDAGIIGRYGGDEFYILTDGIEEEDRLRLMLRNIRGTLELRAKNELGMEKVTLSMGIALFPEHGKNYKDLLAVADKCLYIAKERGKNRYIIYRPEMHADVETGANVKGISSYDEQSKTINQAVLDLFTEGKTAIARTMPMVVKGFDLDSMDVFSVKDGRRIYTCGKYLLEMDCADWLASEKYRNLFDASGMMILNNYNSLKKVMPDIYQILSEKKCMSAIQLALPSVDDPKIFISFNMMNRSHKWSDAEISNLGLYAALIYEILERDGIEEE